MENGNETLLNLEEISNGAAPASSSVPRCSCRCRRESGLERSINNDISERTSSNFQRKEIFIKRLLRDFTENSNIHGLKYIGQKKRTLPERIFWIFMITFSMLLCVVLVKNVWIKWNENPTIVSFIEEPRPVWQIPYPAVTICSETKSMQRKFNFTNKYHKYLNMYINDADPTEENNSYGNDELSEEQTPTTEENRYGDTNLNDEENSTKELTLTEEEEKHLYEDVSMICDKHLAPPDGRNFSSGVDTVTNIKKVSPKINDLIMGCRWKDLSSALDCSHLFSPILTEEGVCFTFNTLAAEDMFRLENLHKDYAYLEHEHRVKSWNLDDGYGKTEPLETYPHRGWSYGMKSSLSILLQSYGADIDYLCKGPTQGYRIALHNPAELPRMSHEYFRSSFSQEAFVAVKPIVTTASEDLWPLHPIRRQCYFSKERYLKYFKVYTQANCETECLSEFTYTRCGCVHFGMPRGPDMEVCGAGSVACLQKAEAELVTMKIQRNFDEVNGVKEDKDEVFDLASKCQCLPSCTSITYEAKVTQVKYDPWSNFRAFGLESAFDKDLFISRVMVFFKKAQFVASRRSVQYYGLTEFLAHCGGLLGLFLGVSILSIAEILYFFTLRIWCNYIRAN